MTLENNRCVCPPASSLLSVDAASCATTCGDGLRHASESCDDGNTNNGDGCTNGCVVEDGYICSGGSVTSADTCTCVPQITGAYYYDDWKKINFSFSHDLAALSICAAIFGDTTLAGMGSSPQCSVAAGTKILDVTLGTNSSLDPFQAILVLSTEMLTNFYVPSCKLPLAQLAPQIIQPPYPNIVPSFDLSFAKSGNDLRVTVTSLLSGSTVFQRVNLVYQTTSANTTDLTTLNNFLQGKSNITSFTIPESQLTKNFSYTLTATATNFVGNTISSSKSADYFFSGTGAPDVPIDQPPINETNITDPSPPPPPPPVNVTQNSTEEAQARQLPINALGASLGLSLIIIIIGGTVGKQLERREKSGVAKFDQRARVQNAIFGKEAGRQKICTALSDQQIGRLEFLLSIKLGERRGPSTTNLEKSLDMSKIGLAHQPSLDTPREIPTDRILVASPRLTGAARSPTIKPLPGSRNTSPTTTSSVGVSKQLDLDSVREVQGEENPEEFMQSPNTPVSDTTRCRLTCGSLLSIASIMLKVLSVSIL